MLRLKDYLKIYEKFTLDVYNRFVDPHYYRIGPRYEVRFDISGRARTPREISLRKIYDDGHERCYITGDGSKLTKHILAKTATILQVDAHKEGVSEPNWFPTKIVTVNGIRYRCSYKPGTWEVDDDRGNVWVVRRHRYPRRNEAGYKSFIKINCYYDNDTSAEVMAHTSNEVKLQIFGRELKLKN